MRSSTAGEVERIGVLLEASRAKRFDNPREMLYLAELALSAALRLDTEELGWPATADLRARVWAEVGNACRLNDRLSQAERAFHAAVAHFEAGTGDPGLLALIADRLATLLCHRRRFRDACSLLDKLYAFYSGQGERRLAAGVLVSRGLYTENSGDPVGAIVVTGHAMDLLNPAEEPELVLAAVHNLLWCATELRRFTLVDRLLGDGRVRLLYGSNRLNLLRLRWLEARVDAGLGRVARGEAAFQEVRAGFVSLGLAFPASVVSLELALLLLRQSRFSEVAAVAQEIIAVFSALGVRREALLSLMLLREACDHGARSASRIRRLLRQALRLLRDLGPGG